MPLKGRTPKDCYEPFRQHIAQLVASTLTKQAVFKVTPADGAQRFVLDMQPDGAMIPLETRSHGRLLHPGGCPSGPLPASKQAFFSLKSGRPRHDSNV
jgi:hypothetical protein